MRQCENAKVKNAKLKKKKKTIDKKKQIWHKLNLLQGCEGEAVISERF